MASSTQPSERHRAVLTIPKIRKVVSDKTEPLLPVSNSVSTNQFLFSPISPNSVASPWILENPIQKQVKTKKVVRAILFDDMPSMEDGSILTGAPEEVAQLNYINDDLEDEYPVLSAAEQDRIHRLQSPDYDECLFQEYWTIQGLTSEHSPQPFLETQTLSAPSQVLIVDKEWERQYQEEVLRWEVSKNLIDNGLRPLSRSVYFLNNKE